MHVDDGGYWRLLMEVVAQIEAKSHADKDPEDADPDQRGPAIFARGPRCGCMYVQKLSPKLVTKTYSKEEDGTKEFF
jgi:hypothetical protein